MGTELLMISARALLVIFMWIPVYFETNRAGKI